MRVQFSAMECIHGAGLPSPPSPPSYPLTTDSRSPTAPGVRLSPFCLLGFLTVRLLNISVLAFLFYKYIHIVRLLGESSVCQCMWELSVSHLISAQGPQHVLGTVDPSLLCWHRCVTFTAHVMAAVLHLIENEGKPVVLALTCTHDRLLTQLVVFPLVLVCRCTVNICWVELKFNLAGFIKSLYKSMSRVTDNCDHLEVESCYRLGAAFVNLSAHC